MAQRNTEAPERPHDYESHTAELAGSETRGQTSRPGTPSASSRTLFDNEMASAVSGGSPNSAPNRIRPASSAPNAPGS